MIKLLFYGALILLAIYGAYNFYEVLWTNIKDKYDLSFQGPVPEGYDLNKFRETGETVPLEDGS